MEMKKVSDLQNADKIKADDLLMVVQNKEDVLTSTKSTTDEMKEFFNQGMVKSVNGEAPDEQGNINVKNLGVEEAPVDDRLYARSNKSWIEIEYKPETGVDSPKFIIDEPIIFPITNVIVMANTTYSIPLIAVSDELSDQLTLFHGSDNDYFTILPHIAKKSDGSRYLVFNTKYSSGVLRFVITDNVNGKEHVIVAKLCSDYLVPLKSCSAKYNKQNRTLTCTMYFYYDTSVKLFPAKYHFSLTPIGNKMDFDNNEKIKFIPAWQHDVLGQFINYSGQDLNLKAVLDKSPEPGLYMCSLYDLYKGNIIETVLTID